MFRNFVIWLLNQLELTTVGVLTPHELAYAINEGFLFPLWRREGLLKRVSSHVVSLDRGRRHRKGGTRWKRLREVKESILFDLLERAISNQTTIPPHLTRHNLIPSARPRMEKGEET